MASRVLVALLTVAAIAYGASLNAEESHPARSRSPQGRVSREVRPQANNLVTFLEPSTEEVWPTNELPLDVGAAPLVAPMPALAGSAGCVEPCWWGRAEYLLWATPGMHVPVLATTGAAADPLPAAIGQPGTDALFGNTFLNDGFRSGGRLTLGAWLDRRGCRGVDVSYLTLGSEETVLSASSEGFAVFGRPFFNTATNNQDARLIASTGNVAGSLEILAETEFDSWEVLYRRAYAGPRNVNFDFVLGYRLAELEDVLRIAESTRSLSGPTTGTSFDLVDRFDTRTTFHGGEAGIVLQGRENPCWSWEAVAKVALGASNYRGGVFGQTATQDGVGNVSTVEGGLLAQDTNIGTHRWDEFAMIGEAGIALRRELRCGWAASLGYSVIYWSDVARAGEQIDTTVNPTQIPPGSLTGPARPAFPFRTTDFWAQGLRLELEYNY
jgi:hypothetical protein